MVEVAGDLVTEPFVDFCASVVVLDCVEVSDNSIELVSGIVDLVGDSVEVD